jgi:hypothetical protein
VEHYTFPNDLKALEEWVTDLRAEEPTVEMVRREAFGLETLALAMHLRARMHVTEAERTRAEAFAQEAAAVARFYLPGLLAPHEACLLCARPGATPPTEACECRGTGWAAGIVPRWELPSTTIRGLTFPAARLRARERWGETVPVRIEYLRRMLDFLDVGQPVGQIVTDEGGAYVLLQPATKEADHG